jgi:hypothetical protein
MSTFDHNLLVAAEIVDEETAPATLWQRCDAWLERAGERLNPILVKETRQALKSKQFVITFVLLLLACWLWSIGGVAIIGPEIYYRQSGPTLFAGYFLILAFPLIVSVPFSAFRSLVNEQEENTYDVLSISTLSPRQIVTGKLGSALVQMVVYFSAVAPCLAFTYLLRGIDIFTMGLLMGYVFFGALGLSAAGLLLATVSKLKLIQVPLSVVLLGGLFFCFFSLIIFTTEILRTGSILIDGEDFLPIHLALANAYITYFVLIVLAAAARLNFPGENGSSRIRAVMLLQQCCFVGWMAWLICVYAAEHEFHLEAATFIGPAIFLAIQWWVMGVFMSGESPELSLRVKRRLPQSLLGRATLTWFFPGPGTGYVFALASFGAIVVMGISVTILFPGYFQWATPVGIRMNSLATVRVGLLTAWGFVASYLGLGNLIIAYLRRKWQINMLVCVLIQVSLPLVGMFVPLVIQLMSPVLRNSSYTLLQITNPLWTMVHLAENGSPPAYMEEIGVLVTAAGTIFFALNVWFLVLPQVRQVRILTPARVLEEEAELHPTPAPQPLSPWD